MPYLYSRTAEKKSSRLLGFQCSDLRTARSIDYTGLSSHRGGRRVRGLLLALFSLTLTPVSRGLELEVVWELSVFVSDHLIDLLLVETCGPAQVSPSQVGPYEVGPF